MTLPNFVLSMSEVEKILADNGGRRPEGTPIYLGRGGNPLGHWRDVSSITDGNKVRLQGTLDRLAEVEGLPALFLVKVNKFYRARQHSVTGVPHPLIRIVAKNHAAVSVMWKGEVWG